MWDGESTVWVEERDSVLCHIPPAEGKTGSLVLTTYFDWNVNSVKCDLQSLISIDAGGRASGMELFVDKQIDNIAAGIIRNENTEFIQYNNPDLEWSFIATFGKQSLDGNIMA